LGLFGDVLNNFFINGDDGFDVAGDFLGEGLI
jgi:hypothetical protein